TGEPSEAKHESVYYILWRVARVQLLVDALRHFIVWPTGRHSARASGWSRLPRSDHESGQVHAGFASRSPAHVARCKWQIADPTPARRNPNSPSKRPRRPPSSLV